MAMRYQDSGHLPYTRTLIGAGMHGRTIIFKVDKKKREYVERLVAHFQSMSL